MKNVLSQMGQVPMNISAIGRNLSGSRYFRSATLLLVVLFALGTNYVWSVNSNVASGTTYAVFNSNTGWAHNTSASGATNNYLYMYKDKYITCPIFCQNGISSIVVKCRKYSSPAAASIPITIQWIDSVSGTATILGTVSPSGTSLGNQTLSSLSNTPTANTRGYLKFQCLGATSTSATKCVGISHITVNYTNGNCASPSPSTYTLVQMDME